MIKAIIFDMDGTMVNTEEMWGDVSRKLAAHHGSTFDEKVWVQMMGKKDYESLSAFKEYFHLDTSVEELIRVRREMILADASIVKVNEGLYELLDLADHLSIKKAVATSSFREFTDKILSSFDLRKRFDVVVTGDDVVLSKPDPAIFLEAAKRLEVIPSACLVLEDAQNGVEAAYRAGMRVFAIPHDASKHHDFSKATKVLSSMLEVDETALGLL
jgi:HAD superfamily hydrolase (TIGR01509 family)